jgi:hypothetical protein
LKLKIKNAKGKMKTAALAALLVFNFSFLLLNSCGQERPNNGGGGGSGGSGIPTSSGSGTNTTLVDPNLAGGIAAIGSKNAMTSTAGAGAVTVYILGNTNFQNAAQSAINNQLYIISPNPFASGNGITMALFSTNAGDGAAYTTNSDGKVINLVDLNAGSVVFTPRNASAGLIPGILQLITDGYDEAIASTAFPGGLSAGNYSGFYSNPSNGIAGIPQPVSGVFRPQTAGWRWAFKVDQTIGDAFVSRFLTVSNTLTVNGSVTLPHASLDSNGVNTTIGDTGSTNQIITGWKYLTTRTAQAYSGPTMQINDSGEGIGNYAGASGGVGIYVIGDASNNPSIKVDNQFSGTAGFVILKSNLVVNGDRVLAKSVASTSTSFQAVTATGFTNNTGSNGFASIKGTAITYTNFDGAGNAYETNTTLVNATDHIFMQAGAKFTAGSGLSGTFHTF